MKLLSLFSGIGAFEKALDNLEIPYELGGYCEVDKYASKSYAAIHGVSESMNLGDITKVDEKALPKNIDLITYGFPCQDISIAGNQKGLFNKDGSQTRSGLFFEALRIIEETQPMVAIAENVKNLTSKNFNAQFQIVLESLEQAGYNNYWKVLNAKDFGIPQSRERVFIVSIRKDIDTGFFQFQEGFPLELRMKDMLEVGVDEKYYIKKEIVQPLNSQHSSGQEPAVRQIGNCCPTKTRENPNQGRIYDADGLAPCLNQMGGGNRQPFILEPVCLNSKGGRGGVDGLQPSLQDRIYDSNAISPAVTTGFMPSFTDGSRIRKLTPKECFRLMGFEDSDFEKAEKVNSNTQLYKQAGNSICVPVVEHIINALLDCGALVEEKEKKQLELKIYNPTADGFIKAIDWNHEEIKKEVASKVSYYKNLVYTDDQIKDAKADRATLNKFVTVLETKRKEIKKQCLAPYEAFEKQMKEIVAIVQEPIAMIDGQVKEYEEKQKQDKLDEIKNFWNSCDVPEGLSFEKIYDYKWLNATASMKSICEAIDAAIEKFKQDIATLHNLPKFSFEAKEVYKSTLSLREALDEAHRLSEIEKKKAEFEAEQARHAAEAEFAKNMNPPVEDTPEAVEEPAKQWISFSALLSTADAMALKEFFNSRNIKFKAI